MPVRPLRLRLLGRDVDHHAEEASHALEAPPREQHGRPLVADEVRRLEHDPLVRRASSGLELEHALLEEAEHAVRPRLGR